MSEHTKEPWAQNGHRIESRDEHGWANDGWIVAGFEGPDAEANIRRTLACVNALAGWQTETVEKYCTDGQPGTPNLGQAFAALLTERVEMRGALHAARDRIQMDRDVLAACHTNPATNDVDEDGRAALAEYDAILKTLDRALVSTGGLA